MIGNAGISGLISDYGIAILAPVAVLEGPIVSVIAGYFARRELLVLWQVIVVVIVADLVGDVAHYAIGRGALDWLPPRLLVRLGLTEARRAEMAALYAKQGMRVLIVGKLTHAVGFAALIGAGAARMRFWSFLLANFVATVPKSLFFVGIGYLFGNASDRIGQWISIGSGIVLLAAGVALAVWLRRRGAS